MLLENLKSQHAENSRENKKTRNTFPPTETVLLTFSIFISALYCGIRVLLLREKDHENGQNLRRLIDKGVFLGFYFHQFVF